MNRLRLPGDHFGLGRAVVASGSELENADVVD
jgi:hypothetical protein